MSIRTAAVAALVGTALVAGAGSAAAEGPTVYTAPVRTLELPLQSWPWGRTITPLPLHCEEDEPCWDCATMGNRICGEPRVLRSIPWGAFGPGGHTGSAGPLRPAP